MNLSERLGVAARERASRPQPLEELELTVRQPQLDVTGPTTAVDLRPGGDTPPSDAARRTSLPAPALGGQNTAPHCPRCGTPARVDINDRTRGVLYLSCDGCFSMWQAPAAATGSAR